MRSQFTILGEIVSVAIRPQRQFKLEVDGSTIPINVDAKHYQDAYDLMGQRVAVTFFGRVSAEKRPAPDVEVRGIKGIATGPDALARLRAFRGSMQDLWGTEEAQEYLESLRRGVTDAD